MTQSEFDDVVEERVKRLRSGLRAWVNADGLKPLLQRLWSAPQYLMTIESLMRLEPGRSDVSREERLEKIRATLTAKGKEYSDSRDRLVNFKLGAELINCSPALCCLAYATKHFVSVLVGLETGLTREQWDEKIGDSINYVILLEAIMKEAQK